MCARGSFVQDYDEANPATHKGYDLRSMPMAALYKEYGLDPMTVDFIGHALALHRHVLYGVDLGIGLGSEHYLLDLVHAHGGPVQGVWLGPHDHRLHRPRARPAQARFSWSKFRFRSEEINPILVHACTRSMARTP